VDRGRKKIDVPEPVKKNRAQTPSGRSCFDRGCRGAASPRVRADDMSGPVAPQPQSVQRGRRRPRCARGASENRFVGAGVTGIPGAGGPL
jgi:hypothetical protein